MTLATDPGAGFEEDTRVELVDPRINAYQIDSAGRAVDLGDGVQGRRAQARHPGPAPSAPRVARSGRRGRKGGEDK